MVHPHPLGRILRHDPRSLAFPAAVAETFSPALHQHFGPVLDQGQIGCCTGNALSQALNTAPFSDGSKLLVEADALHLYSVATTLDDVDGQYPPDDTGSSGLAVCQAAQQAGLIKSYSHCFGIDHFRGALQLSPVIVGIDWYESMFTPDADGVVHPGGEVAGGHEICALGDDGTNIVFLNSWGDGWGQKGYFKISIADFTALLDSDGDATVPEK